MRELGNWIAELIRKLFPAAPVPVRVPVKSKNR